MAWIFAYGSLMWAPGFGFEEKVRGTMEGYHRAFNKRSVVQWGTPPHPAPTLGLEEDGSCDGLVFRVDDAAFPDVMAYLGRREGEGFDFPYVDVTLASGETVRAVVAVNQHDESYIGDRGLEERARMAVEASGEAGTGVEYVLSTREKLEQCGITDAHVEEMAERVQALLDEQEG